MTTPNRKTIIEKAIELFHDERARNNDPSFDITPTEQELKENGFIQTARSMLMRDCHKADVESEFIDYPNEFNVDIAMLFESNALILGSRHTGKSDLAMMIADKCMEKDAVVVVFDPSLDWIARSSIKQYLKVEPYAVLEVPKKSIVYDISLCSPQEQHKILENFSKKLFEYQAQIQERKQYLVILEEAHTYFYQGCMRSKSLMNAVKLISVGRNIQIATLLLSQFSSVLDKYLIKHNTSQIWLGYTREPNDIRYLRQIIGENVSELPKLSDGSFLYVTRDRIQKISIQPFENTVQKQQVTIPQFTPIEPIKPKQDTLKALSSLAIAFLWFIAIIVACSGK